MVLWRPWQSSPAGKGVGLTLGVRSLITALSSSFLASSRCVPMGGQVGLGSSQTCGVQEAGEREGGGPRGWWQVGAGQAQEYVSPRMSNATVWVTSGWTLYPRQIWDGGLITFCSLGCLRTAHLLPTLSPEGRA